MGRFEEALSGAGIPHYFSYPRCPKINGHIERYNRTLQEEFLYSHQDLLLTDLPLFGRRLADWLIFYNAERPHQALGLKSPLEFMVSEKQLSKMCVASTLPVVSLLFGVRYRRWRSF